MEVLAMARMRGRRAALLACLLGSLLCWNPEHVSASTAAKISHEKLHAAWNQALTGALYAPEELPDGLIAEERECRRSKRDLRRAWGMASCGATRFPEAVVP
ncbi:unnamed protein product [Symbiodinium sp. CCMP2592]|nr:unnamed protein product [Symbiodinium sp. CCMP2592]